MYLIDIGQLFETRDLPPPAADIMRSRRPTGIYDEKNKKDKDVFKKFLEDVSDVFKENDFFQGSRNNLKAIIDHIFPHDISFRLVGENDAGKTTIFNQLRGLTVSSKEEILKFSYKKFNQKSIVIKKVIGSIGNIFNLNWQFNASFFGNI